MSWFSSLFGGGGGGGSGVNIDELMRQYGYNPQHTGDFENWGWDLTNRLTGSGQYNIGPDANGNYTFLPLGLGNWDDSLFNANTRSIREQYLGTEGGPQSGRINDILAQANQFGIPEYGLNQSRLANQDLNNSLLDVAARLRDSRAARMAGLVGLGAQLGSSMYGQNLAQHRGNVGSALQGVQLDAELANMIQQQNQASINGLLSGLGGMAGMYFGGPMGAAAGSMAGGTFSKFLNPQQLRNQNYRNNIYDARQF